MTTYKTKVLCDVEYEWEPSSNELFEVSKFSFGDFDIADTLAFFGGLAHLDDAVYNYLKENKDE